LLKYRRTGKFLNFIITKMNAFDVTADMAIVHYDYSF
jgi:hypothetical protein